MASFLRHSFLAPQQLRYTTIFSSRVIATLACRFLRIPYGAHYDNFGIVVPKPPVHAAVGSFARFNGLLHITLKRRKSGAGPRVDSLGLAISFGGDCPEVNSSLFLSGKDQKANEVGEGTERPRSCSRSFPSKPSGQAGFCSDGGDGAFRKSCFEAHLGTRSCRRGPAHQGS